MTHEQICEKYRAMLKLLNEAYVFIGMRHKALAPWQNASDVWLQKVEELTGWNHFEQVELFRKTSKNDTGTEKELTLSAS